MLKKITKETNPECFCKICGKSYLKCDFDIKNTSKFSKNLNGKIYYKQLCSDCFYLKYNRKIHLSVWNKDLAIMFDMPIDEVLEMAKQKYASNNLETFKKKYGEDGEQKYKEYKEFQSLKNTFEYKKQKYGWDDDDFNNYNKSRAVTLENLIKRHGEKQGTEIFNNYCKRQSYAGNKLEYFIEKHGEELGKIKYDELRKIQSPSLQGFQLRHGEELGKIKYDEWYKNRVETISKTVIYSKISQKLFWSIDDLISNNNFIFKEKIDEEYKIFLTSLNKYIYVDFIDLNQNKVIEFFGDYYHANPIKTTADTVIAKCKKTAAEIWETDKKRINALKNDFNIDTLIIWENDYKQNPIECIEKCINFLGFNYKQIIKEKLLKEQQNGIQDL